MYAVDASLDVTRERDPSGTPLGHLTTDPVSGAYARSALDELLAEELTRSRASGGELSLCLFDIDHFKSVNDAYGHARGDRVLCEAVERIRGLVRPSDALFRYGGDEFLLVMPETGKQRALSVMLRVLGGVRRMPFAGDPPLSISLSMGVASFPADADDVPALMEAADRRSYQAKRLGRGCVVGEDAETGGSHVTSRLLERDLATAAAQRFLVRLIDEGRGALRVGGPRGAGHTRFVEEVAKMARLRGFEVVTVGTAAAEAGPATPALPASHEPRGVLVVADEESLWPAANERIRERLGSPPVPRVLGVVLGGARTEHRLPETGIPLLEKVELLPWSRAALRVWARGALRGEPADALVEWLEARSGGLPSRAERALNRLVERRAVEQTAAGAWTIGEDVVASARRAIRRLPVPLTELVGRDREVDDVAAILGSRRLVTLVGAGGIGKTRLSLATAAAVEDDFDDGVVFVALTDATTADDVATELAQVLGVTESPSEPLVRTLADHLEERELLLVLDNFEQALTAAGLVGELLASAPRLKVLVTSRERLRLSGEQVYQVPTLSLPDLASLGTGPEGVAQALRQSSALALFVDRAQAIAYDFTLCSTNLAVVAELCRRLDGLPLAIELAAAHADTLSPDELLERLGGRLDLLVDGPLDVPPRQQALRATIEWSVALLDAADRELLTRLGVFAGGCMLDAVAAVRATRGGRERIEQRLNAFAEKSLLQAATVEDGSVRYTMLETIHAYAVEQLATRADVGEIEARHAAYYAGAAEVAGAELKGPPTQEWLDRLGRDYANLNSGLTWAFANRDADTVMRICTGLLRFWRAGSHMREGRAWLDRLFALGLAPEPRQLPLLHEAAWFALFESDYGRARECAETFLATATALGDRKATALALNVRANIGEDSGAYEQARADYEQAASIWREDEDPNVAVSLTGLANIDLLLGNLDAAYPVACEALARERERGKGYRIAFALSSLGRILLASGDAAAARPHLEECLTLSRTDPDRYLEATALCNLAEVRRAEGDVVSAARLLVAAVRVSDALPFPRELARALDGLGGVVAMAMPGLGVRLAGAAEALREHHGLPVPPVWRAHRQASLDRLRAALGADAFEAAWEAGRAAPLRVVVAEVPTIDPTACVPPGHAAAKAC